MFWMLLMPNRRARGVALITLPLLSFVWKSVARNAGYFSAPSGMPFVLVSSAIGCITSVSPTAFGAIVSFGSVVPFISENATWMMLLHGLFNNPRVASDVSL